MVELRPYNTRTSIIAVARERGHLIVRENGMIIIDTGAALVKMTEHTVTDRENKDISLDDAMALVKAENE